MFQIYTLSDPRTGDVRYVGITGLALKKRLNRHVSMGRKQAPYYVSTWIHQLLEQGTKPEIRLIETTDDLYRERYWIQHYRSLGARLTNLSEGCEGQIGMERSEETRQKIRQAGEKRYLDRRGQKFGLLSPVEIVGHSPVRWRCLCDCGQETIVSSMALGAGKTKSCGCWNRQQAAARTRSRAVHGQWQTSEYRTWVEMKAKCYNTTHLRYPKFGAQGIGVCERWRESFPNFLADMGQRPEEYVLVRKDVSKDFSPENCEWVTKSQKSRQIYEGVQARGTR
ncbi:GIY-YIG nuclease family protein [Armatimonas sp.]|uniref:GIY-YIG nuclease family protein n=1 Tax=Armatimonas sp. TaxID=1872638 RepID=UPI0037529E1D